MTVTQELAKCASCEDALTKEEQEYPVEEFGGLLCCDCEHEHLDFVCCRCQNYERNEHQDECLVVFEPVLGYPSGGHVPTGVYRILTGPYHGGPLIGEAYFFEESLQRIGDLTEEYWEEFGAPCGHLCRDCVTRMTATLT